MSKSAARSWVTSPARRCSSPPPSCPRCDRATRRAEFCAAGGAGKVIVEIYAEQAWPCSRGTAGGVLHCHGFSTLSWVSRCTARQPRFMHRRPWPGSPSAGAVDGERDRRVPHAVHGGAAAGGGHAEQARAPRPAATPGAGVHTDVGWLRNPGSLRWPVRTLSGSQDLLPSSRCRRSWAASSISLCRHSASR